MEIKKNCEKWSSHLSQSFYYKLLIIFLFIRLHSHMLVFAGVLVRAQIFKLLLAVIEGYIVQVAVECIVAQAPMISTSLTLPSFVTMRWLTK